MCYIASFPVHVIYRIVSYSAG